MPCRQPLETGRFWMVLTAITAGLEDGMGRDLQFGVIGGGEGERTGGENFFEIIFSGSRGA